MGADVDGVQRAVVLTVAVVLAGGDGAVDVAVSLFHNGSPFGGDLPSQTADSSMPATPPTIRLRGRMCIPFLSIL